VYIQITGIMDVKRAELFGGKIYKNCSERRFVKGIESSFILDWFC
jgi:hypothetical protein